MCSDLAALRWCQSLWCVGPLFRVCVSLSTDCESAKCVQRKCRCTYVKFHRQTAPIGPGHQPRPIHAPPARIPAPSSADLLYLNPPPPAPIPAIPDPAFALYSDIPPPYHSWGTGTLPWTHPDVYPHAQVGHTPEPSFFPPQPSFGGLLPGIPADDPNVTPMPLKEPRDAQLWKQYMRSPDLPAKRTRVLSMPVASRGESSVRTTLHDEDLSSYEAAVLARKAPTHLCLPRRATIPPPPIDPFTVNRDLSSSLAGVFGPSSDLSLQPPLSSSSSSSSFHLRQDSPSTSSTSTAPGSSSRASSVATEDDDHPSPHDAIPVDDHHHQSNSIKTLSSTHLDTKNQFLIPDQPDAGRMIMIPSPMDPFAFGMN